MILTVDASVAAKWFFKENLKEKADALLDLPYKFNAPELLLSEFLNTLRKYTRQQKITETEGLRALNRFHALPIHYIPTRDLLEPAYRLANNLEHSTYDCIYLAIPVTWGGVMVTADRKFYNKVIGSPYINHIAWFENPPLIEESS